MRILVVGSGAREHAIAWKLAKNPTIDKMFAVPGNAGIEEYAECLDVDVADSETMANLADDLGIDLTVVGPEVPLVAGLADELASRGHAVFGPTAAAARIEGSKTWAKEILAKSGAPTARSRTFTDARAALSYLDELRAPYVVKADGLAAGKGVTVAESRADAERAIAECLVEARFGAAGAQVLVEEFLEGEELSVFCLTDGRTVLPLAEAQDFKRALDGDRGPNTGGMGAYSPVPHLASAVPVSVKEIFEPVVATMAAEGVPYRGLLYGGLMVTAEGPKVIEFNCRFGDPETEVVLPRLEGDLAELLLACVEGNLRDFDVSFAREACVTVVLASGGYPRKYQTGAPISGLDSMPEGVTVFHAGTARAGDRVVTAGGRVLAVTALGAGLAEARSRAYDACERIEFEGKYCRADIALAAAGRGK
jgi:phosphoribosylamine--glycine ligase